MDEDIQHLITPAEVKSFGESSASLEATKILGHSTTTRLRQSECVLARDFLMAKIIIHNANRTGLLANMTMEEFRSARDLEGATGVNCAGL